MPPHHGVTWNPWTVEEDIMLVYFASRGFELPDIGRMIEYKLHRPARSEHRWTIHMERLNRHRAQRGLPPLCDDGMANWNRNAVDDYLIRATYDSRFLRNLLWFHPQYVPLLRTWHEQHVPMHEVLNQRHLHTGLARLVETHRRIYGNPSRCGGHYYR